MDLKIFLKNTMNKKETRKDRLECLLHKRQGINIINIKKMFEI